MPCEHIPLPGGGAAIVCSGGRRQRCACGKRATLLCDWKGSVRTAGTCDEPLCGTCATSPEEGKDLCPRHAAEFQTWLARRAPDRRCER